MIYKFSKVFSLQKFCTVGKTRRDGSFRKKLFLDILPLWFCFLQYCAFHTVLITWGEKRYTKGIIDAMLFCPWPMCLGTKSLGFSVPWTLHSFDDVPLGRCVPWTTRPMDDVSLGRCVPWSRRPWPMCPDLWDRQTDWDRLARTVEAVEYTYI